MRGASGVPPPMNIITAEITPITTDTQAKTLNIMELIPKNL